MFDHIPGPIVKCKYCGGEHQSFINPIVVHSGGYFKCNGKHIWLPKSDGDKKPKRKTNANLLSLIPKEFQDQCMWCLRKREHLLQLDPPVFMQVHHIIEVENDGTDDPYNLMNLCFECHSEVHRKREQLGRYVK